ncbi:iqgap- protein [Mucor velutinosus]|uniref:Iqgap- protein n=1 Tax=Mucor velutinosus TaxID=708070 RepID=A0AAN7D2U9_9FUNG|nr:iqgap- protein [Mucor velutinosus]
METPVSTAAATAAVEVKSEFLPLTRIQIILIAIFSSVVLFLLFCTIVYQIYKRIRAKRQQKAAENGRHDEMAVGDQHRSTRPIIDNTCTEVNSTAFLNPSASTTFTISSSQSTSRFQEYFPT